VIVLFSSYALAGTWQSIDPLVSNYTQLYSVDGSNILGCLHGVDDVRYNGTTWSYLPDVPGYSNTQASAISGGVVVGSCYSSPYSKKGFTYNGSSWTTYDAPGATYTWMEGIDGGNIVGNYQKGDASYYSFLYNGSTWTTIGYYPGAKSSSVSSISGDNIVGNYQQSNGLGHGFVYNYKTTQWTNIDFPGASYTNIYDIDGQNIVGCYSLSGFHGFLYNGSTWTTLDFPGADYTQVEGISGNTLVGWYTTGSNGYPHGFVYTIPEPATILLFGLGARLCLRASPKRAAILRRKRS
jgi:hypothetical protein